MGIKVEFWFSFSGCFSLVSAAVSTGFHTQVLGQLVLPLFPQTLSISGRGGAFQHLSAFCGLAWSCQFHLKDACMPTGASLPLSVIKELCRFVLSSTGQTVVPQRPTTECSAEILHDWGRLGASCLAVCAELCFAVYSPCSSSFSSSSSSSLVTPRFPLCSPVCMSGFGIHDCQLVFFRY